MTYSHSPSPRQLAVPGIGFPQNISVGSDGPCAEVSRDWSVPMPGRKTGDAPMQLVDCIPWLSSSWPWSSARW
jgi:hypothetical protein